MLIPASPVPSTSSHIELHRTFTELLRDDKHGDDPRALSVGNATLTLPDLLDESRVIILAEAGSGKTEEIRHASRKLRSEGKRAFYLRLEHVFVDFDTAFEEGTLEEFHAWLASSEQGWVLLDSIDEARLRSPQDFEAAIRKVSKQLATAKQRTHLVITGRAPAWRPRTDLELCGKLFPIADNQISEGGRSADEQQQVGTVADATPFKVVTLSDLSTEQIRRFAEMRGISNTQAFLDALERADAWSFTARPQDLDELTGYWLDKGGIGTRLDLMLNSVKRRLKEPDQTRAECLPLPSDRALAGAQLIAAALVLTNLQTIQVPDGGKGSHGLKLDILLTDWADKEVGTLLQRPLFAPDVYGTVRFHHRSVKEYLAAQWFLKLLGQEVSRRKIEELFFRTQYDLDVVVPSLRPLLPWLAMVDERILSRVRRIAPEIVFEGGDPVQLPAQVRSSMLEQICEQLSSGASTRSMADLAAIQRFAAPDVTPTLRQLVQKYRSDDDIMFFLMRMVWQGRLNGALPEAIEIASSPNADYASRIAAFRAIADVGEEKDLAAVRGKFAEEGEALNRRCLADLVSHIQHPDEQDLQWVIRCIPNLAPHEEYESTGLSDEIASFFERAPLKIVERGIEELHQLLTSPPVIERRFCEISQRYQWLRQAAGSAVSRLIAARDPSALTPTLLEVFDLVHAEGAYDYRYFDNLKKLGLDTGVQQWYELKWALFWHVVAKERKRLAEEGVPMVHPWMALALARYLTFDGTDYDVAVGAIVQRTAPDEKLVALSLAFNLYVQMGQQRSRYAQLTKAIGNDDALKSRLAELRKPPKKSEELKRLERKSLRRRQAAAARREREEIARLEAPRILEAQLDTLRDPGFGNPSAISQSQHYLFNRMRELEGSKTGAKWTNCNWHALEPEFGHTTPRAFRDGMVRYWRKHVPLLVSEGAAKNSMPLSDLFGLAGLTIEANESSDLFDLMRPTEAALAFRYAMRELNGFPDWFPMLSVAHIEVVKAMTLLETIYELESDEPGALSQYIIYDVSRVGDWLWDSIAPDIARLIRVYPPKSVERLRHLLDILQASNLLDNELASMAAAATASAAPLDHLAFWLAMWTGVDAGPAVDAFEAQLSKLENSTARTEFAMCYVTNLLGGDGRSLRVRTGFHSPALLRRLYVLIHSHVRSREDVDRANSGCYSPGLRDNAQDARERLIGILRDIPGRDAYLAMRGIAESHPDPAMRPRFALQARSKAETDSERPAWSAEQVSQFGKDFERTPANHRELFDLAVSRLLDLKHEMEEGDASTASVLITAELETLVRNYIGVWCSKSSQGRYVIPQEEELPDAKRPDIRWHGFAFKGPVPTELKIADKWTGPQLFERLEGQLAGDYLRDDASTRGIYLLVHRGLQKRWQLPNGDMANFDELLVALQGHWISVASAHPRVEEIKVIGIDLTKRAKAPLPKKTPGKGASGDKRKARPGSNGPGGKEITVKKVIVKRGRGEPDSAKASRRNNGGN